MNKAHIFFRFLLFIALCTGCSSQHTVLRFSGPQNMCIHGKGQGKDAVLGPNPTAERLAKVKNLGCRPISLRVEKQGGYITTTFVYPKKNIALVLEKNEVLYLDTDTGGKVRFQTQKN